MSDGSSVEPGLAVGDEVMLTSKTILKPIMWYSSEGRHGDSGSIRTYVNKGSGIQRQH